MRMLVRFLMLISPSLHVAAQTYYQKEMDVFYAFAEAYHHNNFSTSSFIPTQGAGTTAMTVWADVFLLALQDFDEVAGAVEMMVILKLEWTDPILFVTEKNISAIIDTFPYRITSIVIPKGTVWMPELVIYNSVDVDDAIGDDTSQPRYYIASGNVQWNPKVKVKSICEVDVMFFPFDKQKCTVTLMPWEYTDNEIEFKLETGTVDTSKFQENGEWNLADTALWTEVVDSTPRLEFSVTMQRRPLYYTFNILAPILVLVVLNSFVFWLPVETGERVSFSVTCFLSFMVVLNMVMSFLPRTSHPLSYLCYYVVCMMIFSGAQSATVVLEMRLFHHSEKDKVPNNIRALILFFKCRKCGKSKPNEDDVHPIITVSPVEQKKSNHKVDRKDTKVRSISNDKAKEAQQANFAEAEEDEVTWAETTRFMDAFLFACFFGGQLFFTLAYLSPLLAQA